MKNLLSLLFICNFLGIIVGIPVDDLTESTQIEGSNVAETISTDTTESGEPEEGPEEEKRIISGSRTKSMSDSPYMVSLLKQTGSLKKICGGSIIHQRWILTAAHCLTPGESNYYIKAGSLDPYDQNSGQLVRVSKMFIHPCYKKGTYESINDIALLKLAADLKFNQNVQAIFLPRPNHDAETIATGQVHGWGAIDRKDHTKTSTYLLHAPGRTAPASVCNKAGLHADKTKICLQKSSQSVCFGDSGGPFTQKDAASGHDVVSGLVSESGKICGEKPVLFTRVSSFLPWINNIFQTEAEYLPCYEASPSWL